jgi:hypothetical protein
VEVNTHHNQDKVLKESMEIFKGGTLDFLGVEANGTIEDILSGEITETTTKKAYADTVFRVSGNKGLHLEWEASISEADMKRFACYHFDLHQKHSLNFETVIITNKPSSVEPIKTVSGSFAPKIICLKNRDAEVTIADIEGKLTKGERINLLELLYLPLYGNTNRTEGELFSYAIKTTPKAVYNKHSQGKLLSLMMLLISTFISKNDFKQALEENAMLLENNPAAEFFGERAAKKTKTEAAVKMLQEGLDIAIIARVLEMPIEWVRELQYSQEAAMV